MERLSLRGAHARIPQAGLGKDPDRIDDSKTTQGVGLDSQRELVHPRSNCCGPARSFSRAVAAEQRRWRVQGLFLPPRWASTRLGRPESELRMNGA